MKNSVSIPRGDEKITVELTVKEAIALSSGARFNDQKSLVLDARKKLMNSVEHKLLPEMDSAGYTAAEL